MNDIHCKTRQNVLQPFSTFRVRQNSACLCLAPKNKKDVKLLNNKTAREQQRNILIAVTTKDDTVMTKCIDAEPYQWPFNGKLETSNTCIIVIDMQVCMKKRKTIELIASFLLCLSLLIAYRSIFVLPEVMLIKWDMT